ncbi:MAG TPA: hypothetical protein VF198_06875 [Vicinamibacterales bacterium]
MAAAALLLVLIGNGATAQGPATAGTPPPCLYQDGAPADAASIRSAGVAAICAPAAAVDAWKAAGFEVTAIDTADLAARELLATPGVLRGQRVASATRTPFVVSNGWRIRRGPDTRYRYNLPVERAALAAVEAATWGADAVLQLEAPGDLAPLGRVHQFLRKLPDRDLPHMADFAMVDDGSDEAGEVMNLFTRRNLLYEIVKAPSDRFALNIQLGTPEFPRMSTSDPSAFALRVRRRIGDEARSLRIYGSEVTIARAGADANGARVHLINYTGRQVFGLRVRLRGVYEPEGAYVLGVERSALEDVAVVDGFTEFTIPQMGLFAVVDLRKVPGSTQ